MVKNTKDRYRQITLQQIDDLTAIYDDYLFISRQHELLLDMASAEDLALLQMMDLHNGDPKISWHFSRMTVDERKAFKDFIDNNVYAPNKAFITLQHIKTEEDKAKSPIFAVPPYLHKDVPMQLPSDIGRYTLVYPKDGLVGNTEIYVDGVYKIYYIEQEHKNDLLKTCVKDHDFMDEIAVIIDLAEKFQKDPNINEQQLRKLLLHTYAAKQLNANENIILELLASFAEKLQSVLRYRYRLFGDDKTAFAQNQEAFKLAEEEGLIKSAEVFFDYTNIRHFIRHQWDVVGTRVRDDYANSYLKLCDKTTKTNKQRMKGYIDVLHQMQHVISAINPNRMIRDTTESNSKFLKRVKATLSGPDIKIELNHPLSSDKYYALNKNFEKILPWVEIVDDFFQDQEKKEHEIDTYGERSWFLQNFYSLERDIMNYCEMRGCNFDKQEAWEYMEKMGLLSPQEFIEWQEYGRKRNRISHDYFNQEYKDWLETHSDEYLKNLSLLSDRLESVMPNIKHLRDDVYEFSHSDGLIVVYDLKRHKPLYRRRLNKVNVKIPDLQAIENHLLKQQKGTQKETYPSGVEFEILKDKIISVKIPNGVIVNFYNQSIEFDSRVHWCMDLDNFNLLKTEKNTLITDKNLRVINFYEEKRKTPIDNGDKILLDYRHGLTIDAVGFIRELKVRKRVSGPVLATFKHSVDGYNMVSFADGTIVVQHGKEVLVVHNNMVLTYANRKMFAATYGLIKPTLQKAVKPENVRQ